MKTSKTKVIVGTLLCFVPVILGLYLWDDLPLEVPVHFDINGNPDSYSSKAFAVFFLPALMAFINGICHFAARFEKRTENYSKKLYELMYWLVPIMANTLCPITLYKALGKDIRIDIFVSAFLSFIFIIIGNYLPKCKQNHSMGIKIPWTLKSEENWNKTHHLGGYIYMATGIIGLVSSLIGAPVVFAAALVISLIVPILYSYSLHKKGI